MPVAGPTALVRLWGAAALLLTLAWPAGSAALASLPPPAGETGRRPAPLSGRPSTGGRSLELSALPMLFARLAQGDRQWLPVARRLPDGRVLVTQRRLTGDPPPAPGELEAMLRHPPTWERERRVIARLLARLRSLGITVVFEPLISPQAGGQWTPNRLRLSLQPDLPDRGTRLFSLVLNHEAIHVAQSCRAGGLRAQPRPLDLGGSPAPAQRRLLNHPLYRRSPAVQAVEREAVIHQADLSLGLALLERHCSGVGPPGRLAG
ncbi:MAG: hypothetical protein VKO65_07755 [Cyanobacteriota bacterium]|nr:hypothetical protein [Cyanobacteriota bacterium]